jgi:hypothetical protein
MANGIDQSTVPVAVSLVRLKCNEQEDTEVIFDTQDDEPYVLVITVDGQGIRNVGGATIPAVTAKLTRIGPIEDFDEGDTKSAPANTLWGLGGGFAAIPNIDRVFFLVALLENDTAEPGDVENRTLAATAALPGLASLAFARTDLDDAARFALFTSTARQSMDGVVSAARLAFPDPDDKIGPVQVLTFSRQEQQDVISRSNPIFERTLRFTGDDADYELTFAMRALAIARPGAYVAMAKQTEDILSGLYVDTEGFLNVVFVSGTGSWLGPVRISGPIFPPGAPVAMANQTNDVLAALVVDKEGFLNVSFVVGTGGWQGPVRIRRADRFVPGAHIAMAKQTDGLLTALIVDKDGFLNVAFVEGTGEWQGPVRISGPNFDAITPIAMAKQTRDVLSALLVDKDGFLNVSFVVGIGGWQGPKRIGRPNFARETHVAMAKQTDGLLTALLVDKDGFLNVTFVIGTEEWHHPIGISGPNFSPGAPIAMAKQTDDVLTALAVDKDGFLNVSFVVGTSSWQGPIRISGSAFPNRCPIAMAKQTDDIQTALAFDSGGVLTVSFVVGTGTWQTAIRI